MSEARGDTCAGTNPDAERIVDRRLRAKIPDTVRNRTKRVPTQRSTNSQWQVPPIKNRTGDPVRPTSKYPRLSVRAVTCRNPKAHRFSLQVKVRAGPAPEAADSLLHRRLQADAYESELRVNA